MPDMTPTSLVTAVLACTSKIIKNGLGVFERGEQKATKGYTTLCIYVSQSSEIVLEFRQTKKWLF